MLFLCCQNASSPYDPSLWRWATKSTSNLSGFYLKTMYQPVAPRSWGKDEGCRADSFPFTWALTEAKSLWVITSLVFPRVGLPTYPHYQQRPLQAQDWIRPQTHTTNPSAFPLPNERPPLCLLLWRPCPPPLLRFPMCAILGWTQVWTILVSKINQPTLNNKIKTLVQPQGWAEGE